MLIEVAVGQDQPNDEKGKLLERVACDFLSTQGYDVSDRVSVTAAELDLLCQHKVAGKKVYVECKAHREPLSSNHLTKLLGVVTFKNYDEGWLVSAGPLGKDAKGFQSEWEGRPVEERQRLSIYTPERVLEALVSARLIASRPQELAGHLLGSTDRIGDWTLLLTPFGTYWLATCIESGVPAGVLAFHGDKGNVVDDRKLLHRLAQTDSTKRGLDFEYVHRAGPGASGQGAAPELEPVVEVQQADKWADYRPARPQDFVGRSQAQRSILDFLENVRRGTTGTRVFAVTGDSGMGKSSLIAKLRYTLCNLRNRRRYYLYPVDVRAAKGPSYVLSSLLACLHKAADQGLGNGDAGHLRVDDPSQPLAGERISEFLAELAKRGQVVCVVYDQFEELYSKSELFPVFEQAQRLAVSAISARSSLVVGFAWRTDATVPQAHPAYYLWHRLSDHRFEVPLGPLMHSEASSAVTLFERELGQKIRPELRRYLIESSQGYPWLLKKLAIHVYEQIRSGASQAELSDRALDVASLFDRDLRTLTKAERACVDAIAKSAPADWYEILDISGHEVMRALQDKRMIVRSGDHLNLYWDIFREYVLTEKAPSIPFTYLPSSPSLKSLLAVAKQLGRSVTTNHDRLSGITGLSKKTVGNVVRDLIMFGVAAGGSASVGLDGIMEGSEPRQVLSRIRDVLRRHALTLRLSKIEEGTLITADDIVALLKEINPAAGHRAKTWRVYAERMGHWLLAGGFLETAAGGFIRRDRGQVAEPAFRGAGKRSDVFTGDAPPARVLQALQWLVRTQPQTEEAVTQHGYGNAVSVLLRFRLVGHEPGRGFVVRGGQVEGAPMVQAIWDVARAEGAVQDVVTYLREHPTATGPAIGRFGKEKWGKTWSAGSERRIGNALRQWASWIIAGQDQGRPPAPPGPRCGQRALVSPLPDLFAHNLRVSRSSPPRDDAPADPTAC
ncbi:MAG: AAA family ATPase [bacterium]|nr:AAA family ATPase [bacterium]